MTVVSTTIELDATPQQVWDVVMDPDHLKDWVTIHRRLNQKPDGPPREGIEMVQTLCLRGASFKVDWTLVACEAPGRAVWEGHGPARSRARTEYVLTPKGKGTCFDYRNEFRAPLGPLGAIASRAIVGGIPEREAKRSLERLRALVEGG